LRDLKINGEPLRFNITLENNQSEYKEVNDWEINHNNTIRSNINLCIQKALPPSDPIIMAIKTVRELLNDPNYRFRSFKTFQEKLGGFGSDELRRILIQAGAIRCYKKNKPRNEENELWRLIDN